MNLFMIETRVLFLEGKWGFLGFYLAMTMVNKLNPTAFQELKLF